MTVTNLHRDPLRSDYVFDAEFERSYAAQTFADTSLRARKRDAAAMLAALAEIDRLKAALTVALADVWAVESHSAVSGSLEHQHAARIVEKSMLQRARHRIESAVASCHGDA